MGKKYEIPVHIARGLEYFLRGCSIWLCLKKLQCLDRDFCPKISDFGLEMLQERRKLGFSNRKNIYVRASHSSEIYFPDSIYEHLESGEVSALHGVITDEEEGTVRKIVMAAEFIFFLEKKRQLNCLALDME
ncbi:hypothetical protein SADUNF_Sadunf17G0109700 [Salix dunnii]|uniref:Uncharacterized protein n=1 Tax=Salix dunnii TaxID=1413687 RepID=A0A835J7R3_9ROSI|nr:hypothetical protein SADUNF_Sadunf17G0109700 [Salix dunnii]